MHLQGTFSACCYPQPLLRSISLARGSCRTRAVAARAPVHLPFVHSVKYQRSTSMARRGPPLLGVLHLDEAEAGCSVEAQVGALAAAAVTSNASRLYLAITGELIGTVHAWGMHKEKTPCRPTMQDQNATMQAHTHTHTHTRSCGPTHPHAHPLLRPHSPTTLPTRRRRRHVPRLHARPHLRPRPRV
jgi:hypothetical protein